MGRRRAVPSSRMPCRTDVLALLCDIDQAVAGWEPDAKGTLERLHRLAGHGYRPQDYELLRGYCSAIEGWVLRAAELLGDSAPVVALRLPCPSCGEQFVYRRNGSGELVR
jgi:hypothetical protein